MTKSYIAPDIVIKMFAKDITDKNKEFAVKILAMAKRNPLVELITSDFCLLEAFNALKGKELDRETMLLFFEVVAITPTTMALKAEYMATPKEERAMKLLKIAGLGE